jgi:hypothetical protein
MVFESQELPPPTDKIAMYGAWHWPLLYRDMSDALLDAEMKAPFTNTKEAMNE